MAAEEESVEEESVLALHEQFEKALHAEVVGITDKGGWLCECGDTGTAGDETMAGLALYLHRRRSTHEVPPRR